MKIINTIEAITFDDVLLEPQYTTIESRRDVSLVTKVTKRHNINIPIISANMDTVSEAPMLIAMHGLGGLGILHRFMSDEEKILNVKQFRESCPEGLLAISIGVNNEESPDLIKKLQEYNLNIICIDIAHGACNKMLRTIERLKSAYSDIDIIAGNVATYDATRSLCSVGADAIKCGIGPGSMCTTRIVTGCGVPQLTAIIECCEAAWNYDVPVIADGGLRNSGDISKSLAAGAKSVMCGGLLSGTTETPGELMQDMKNNKFKKYRGMASKDAMIEYKGERYSNVTPEGEITFVPYKGSVVDIVNNLIGGIRSSMTYNNARTVVELQNNAIFRRTSYNSRNENIAHGLNR